MEGSMVFKHQVKKEYNVPEDLHPVRFVFNHVAQLLIEWIRRCLPALDKEKSPELSVIITQEKARLTLKLTLNVPLEESASLNEFPTELIPFEIGIRLPISYYIERLERQGHQVELKNESQKTVLQIVFPR
jgi:hypothetical protein